jgi:uncharacterized protein (TIGR00106 family)
MIVDFSIAPVGKGESLSASLVEVFELVDASGLSFEHHAMGTNIEGDWDEVMALVKACRDRMLEKAKRVSISLRIDDRLGVTDGIRRKVASVEAKRRH